MTEQTCRRLIIAGLSAAAAATASLPALAAPAKYGWQGPGTVDVPQGEVSYFIGYPSCPSKYPRAVSGSYVFNSAGQASDVSVNFNGVRLDESPPDYTSWGWHFYWPNGAPANVVLTIDVYCAQLKAPEVP